MVAGVRMMLKWLFAAACWLRSARGVGRSKSRRGATLAATAVFAAAAVPVWRRLASGAGAASGINPFLNRRAAALVGRVFTLEKPIIDGTGTVRIDDTVWRVAGPDTPAGTRVRVVEAKGANLTVAAA